MSKVIDVSIAHPIDVAKAIEQSSGQKSLFFKMLEKLEQMALHPNLKELAAQVEKGDYLQMKNKAHMLKGASGYVAAGPVHYCCYQIQDNYNQSNYDKMLAYYPSLVEAALDFKVYSRKIIAEHKGKPQSVLISSVISVIFGKLIVLEEVFDENKLPPDVFECPLAKGYSIVRANSKFYCLRQD